MSALGIALSLLIGISLGFFGGGGSVLTVPLLVYVFGMDVKAAITGSLLVVGAASASGALQHGRRGNVEVRVGLLFGSAGMAGAYTGGRAGAYLDGTLLMLLFASMMVLTATAMWRGRRAPTRPASGERATGHLLAQGFGVGLFTGLVGAGGGILIVPALALWAGLSMPSAVGTSLMIIVLNCLAGFAGYASHVRPDYLVVGAVAATAIGGSFLGSRLAHRIEPASLRRAFAVFVAAMAAMIFVREGDAWAEAAWAAIPRSAPQVVFALVVLAIGIAAGRATRRAAGDPLADRVFSDGAGI
jgi:hypothetical protein